MTPDPLLPPVLQEAIAKFHRWVDDEYLRPEQASGIETPLYHYTDARGLKGIIESGRIWFTDYRHLNDPSELLHGMELAHLAASDLALQVDEQVGAFLGTFRDMFRHRKFQATLDFYIASFSRCRDDLGQWRAYADNGRGFAIGCSPRMFAITAGPAPDRPAEFVGPVLYRGEELLGRFRAPIQQAAQIFLEVTEANAADVATNQAISRVFMQELARDLIASPMIWCCLTTKHPAYEHENEVRLVITGTPEHLRKYITTRFRGSEIVPYVPQPIPLREQNNILEIMVGPSAPQDTERTLRTMLNSLEIEQEVFIHRSDIPYRAV